MASDLAHTNTIEGTWTHAKKKAIKHGGRKTEETLKQDLTEFMWRKQRGLTRTTDAYRQMFSDKPEVKDNFLSLRHNLNKQCMLICIAMYTTTWLATITLEL